MKNLPLLLITLVLTLMLGGLIVAVFTHQDVQVNKIDDTKLLAEARHIMGNKDNPKVTLVEFSDFQCPACKVSHPLVKEVMDKHGDQVKLVFRHYPIKTFHPYALLAAKAAEAAGEFGQFWPMHDLLFTKQDEWSELKTPEEVQTKFVSFAQELGIDKAEFLAKIQSKAIEENINKDMALADEVKLSATPTFYLNGRKVAAPHELIKAVESQL